MKRETFGLCALALLLLGAFEARAMDKTAAEQTTTPEVRLKDIEPVLKETDSKTRITVTLSKDNLIQFWDLFGGLLKTVRVPKDTQVRRLSFYKDLTLNPTQLLVESTMGVSQVGLPVYTTRSEMLQKEKEKREDFVTFTESKKVTQVIAQALLDETLPKEKYQDEIAIQSLSKYPSEKAIDPSKYGQMTATLNEKGHIKLWDNKGDLLVMIEGDYTMPLTFKFTKDWLIIKTKEEKEELALPLFSTREEIEQEARAGRIV